MISNDIFKCQYVDYDKIERDEEGHVRMIRAKDIKKIRDLLNLGEDTEDSKSVDKNNNKKEESYYKLNIRFEDDTENEQEPIKRDLNSETETTQYENTPYEDFLEKVNNDVMDILPIKAKHLFPELYMGTKPMPQQARDYLRRCNRGLERFDQITYFVLYTYPWEDSPENASATTKNNNDNNNKV